MKQDRRGNIAYTSAQKPLGEALCAHYGVDWDESFLFLNNGRPYVKFSGYFAVAAAMGGIWHGSARQGNPLECAIKLAAS